MARKQIKLTVQRELWGRAAGRCEFSGCNILLYKDDLTQQSHNGATIAHIVAYGPDGPRGDPVRSLELREDIKNLMLVCKQHGTLVDNKAYEKQYSEELLLTYKHEHEERIRLTTAALNDKRTTVLIAQGRISGKKTSIGVSEIREAIKPRWPNSENPPTIDLNDVTLGETKGAYWETCQDKIKSEVDHLLKRAINKEQPEHLSVFALLPVPLLFLLGYRIGSRIPCDLYNCHRNQGAKRWCWDDSDTDASALTDTFEHDNSSEGEQISDVAIVISMTSKVDLEAVSRAIGQGHVIYEIRARETGTDFLKHRSQLSLFSAEYRRLLTLIREQHKHVDRVHVFMAAPSPIPIEAGRQVLEKADPEIVVYEYEKPNYHSTVRVNQRSS